MVKIPSAKSIHNSKKPQESEAFNNFAKKMSMDHKEKSNVPFAQNQNLSKFIPYKNNQEESSNINHGKVFGERKSSLKEIMHTKKISKG